MILTFALFILVLDMSSPSIPMRWIMSIEPLTRANYPQWWEKINMGLETFEIDKAIMDKRLEEQFVSGSDHWIVWPILLQAHARFRKIRPRATSQWPEAGEPNARRVSIGLVSHQLTVTDVQDQDCLLSLSFPYKKGDVGRS
jgi:hypothetical protein